VTRIAVNGINLNVEDSGDGPALLLLHGFTGNVETWEPFLEAWKEFRLIRVDIIGHGASDSPEDAARFSMDAAVADLLAVLDSLNVADFGVVGYSMGGRLALHLALAAPERLWALVLEGASPGIEDEAERAARAQADNELADTIGKTGLEAFVNRWQAQPLFASQSRLPAEVFQRQRNQRLASSPVGLANSLRGMGAGRQAYLMPRLGALRVPVLLLAGSLDERYAGIARDLDRVFRDATIEFVPDAGHAAHLEQPSHFSREVLGFLRRCQARARTRSGATGSGPRWVG
jgi:2-succinyl-6-hydroxy-2,4-cyclohexadiene-1-carboxylate synthase